MKKLLAIILLLIHTLASSGVVLSAHYCMGDFEGVRIGHNDQQADHCATCGMKDMGCCHDEPQLIKLDNTDIQKTAVAFPDFKISLPGAQQYHSTSNAVLPKSSFQQAQSFETGQPPTYKLICVYRI